MKKAFLLVLILFVSVMSTACINNFAVQELNTKAKAALDAGDYDTAINRLKSSIDLDGTVFQTHYNLGIAYTQAEKYPEAVETFKTAEKLKPNFPDTYYSLGVAEENYANGIINGTIKKNKQGIYESIKAQSDGNNSNVQASSVKLAKADKDKIADLFNDAIQSYKTYLKKGSKENDTDEVKHRIEYLSGQCYKYAPDKYQPVSENSEQQQDEEQ